MLAAMFFPLLPLCALLPSAVTARLFLRDVLSSAEPATLDVSMAMANVTASDPAAFCEERATPWNECHNVIFFDRHHVDCGTSGALRKMRAAHENGTKAQFVYTCCGLVGGADLIERATPMVLTSVHLRRSHSGQYQYEYKCTNMSQYTPEQQTAISCRSLNTPMETDGGSADPAAWFHLDRHRLECEANEGLNSFHLKRGSAGQKVSYDGLINQKSVVNQNLGIVAQNLTQRISTLDNTIKGLEDSLTAGGCPLPSTHQNESAPAPPANTTNNTTSISLMQTEAEGPPLPIELGRVDNDVKAWIPVQTKSSFVMPVVIGGVPDMRGRQEAVVRIRNVQPGSFELRLDEPAPCRDQWHLRTPIDWMVVESGVHKLVTTIPQGLTVAAGTVSVPGNKQFVPVPFPPEATFTSTPVLLVQVQTYASGRVFLKQRVKDLSPAGFKVALETQGRQLRDPKNPSDFEAEVLGYVAFSQPVQSILTTPTVSVSINGGITPTQLTEKTHRIDFAFSIPNAHFFANIATFNGGDVGQLRVQKRGDTFAEIFIQEEKCSPL
ncbi:unnamed protein product [Vitrella brassicaformis CCMP3155]|uniref:Uncharacterized protein n=1 Tax=Vitrella brassicaformis (strain CCMP3155) TaxID=1169540 RepID=A0A0G4F907_VITBC|nr:unnamed protein product [Vitrella brassicaformis CCMP3155]|eukprot:CEM08820.1 unnamed protein product [Vitrella brassicaformis CCMP3155]